jgi:glycerophosphoryl diester phosphodiesterase
MSNNTNTNEFAALKAVTKAAVSRELAGIECDIQVSDLNVWVAIAREETKGRQILKDLGFRWTPKRAAYWRRLDAEWLGSKEPMTADEIRGFLGAEPKALSVEAVHEEPKAPETVAEPTVQEVEAIAAEAEKELAEGKLIALSFDRDWCWVSGEATRKIKAQLMELGFRWSARRKAWYNRNGKAVDGVKLQTLIGLAYA